MSGPAVTWWGHAACTLELGGVRVALDPLLVPRRLAHLRRTGPPPAPSAAVADVVLVSHLHLDHLHVPSLAAFDPTTPLVVPRGALTAVRGLRALHEREDRTVREVEPGERLRVGGVDVRVLAADHDGRRWPARGQAPAPALGFRLDAGSRSCWYPGDTGPPAPAALDAVGPVDLAVVPIGGWGPSLGADHLDPEQAADAVEAVGARAALAVHYGTFWPWGLDRMHPESHRRLFLAPPGRFRAALAGRGVTALTPPPGERVVL